MEDKDKKEEMIEKLIEKRKQENDAFMKLLNAIKIKEQVQGGKLPQPKEAKTKKKDE